jgi:hypothetical protein
MFQAEVFLFFESNKIVRLLYMSLFIDFIETGVLSLSFLSEFYHQTCSKGATTFSITTLSIMTFSIMTIITITFSIMTISTMTISTMTFRIRTFRIRTFSIMTFST